MSSDSIHPLVSEELATQSFWNSGVRNNYLNRPSKTNKKFVMIDGPPFATGQPHHGHCLAGSIKDVVMRYMTMQGKEINKIAGYDCHGVPMEMAVNKKLNISSKADVERIGIDKYCQECKESVLSCADDWTTFMNRYGRWANFENPYTTMDLKYMKTVWKVFSDMNDQRYLDQGYRICSYSPKLETSLSNFESSLAYEIRNDQSVTVRFKLNFSLFEHENKAHYLAVFTTTPWTLPGNMALAINKNQKYYAKIDETSVTFYIISPSTIIKDDIIFMDGVDLIGASYEPLFDNMLNYTNENMFKIYHGDFVTTDVGTGAVHIAPLFGEDDYQLCMQVDIIDADKRIIRENDYLNSACEIDDRIGFKFDPNYVKTVCYQFNNKVIRHIQEHLPNNFLETKQITHSYPHCWRTGVPLVYRAISAWFVTVSKFKDELVDANKEINWYPKNIGCGRFNEWLSNARDWNISRSRYWGVPIPVWTAPSGKYIIIRSPNHLEQLCGLEAESITDLHRDKIDHLTFVVDNETYTRIDSVLDCWYESGAAIDYFEEKQADFIAEGLDQTRGWFYTLLIEGFVRNKKPAFKNVVVNGLILGNDGKKMSKSSKNYTEPSVLINKYGADAFRLYLLSSPAVQGLEFAFNDEGVKDMLRTILIPLSSSVNFCLTYIKLHNDMFVFEDLNYPAKECLQHPFNIWLLHKVAEFEKAMHEYYKSYQLSKLVNCFKEFIELLNNVYIKLNRQIMKEAMDDLTIESLTVLGFTLIRIAYMVAPIAPFIAEYVYRNVKHLFSGPDVSSIHLCYYSDFYVSILANDHQMYEFADIFETLHEIVDKQNKIVSTIDDELKLLDHVRKLRYENNLPKSKMLRTAYYFTDDFTDLSSEISNEINTLDVKIISLNSFKTYPIKFVPRPIIKIICQTFKKNGKQVQDLIMKLTETELETLRTSGSIVVNQFEVVSNMVEWTYSLVNKDRRDCVPMNMDEGHQMLMDRITCNNTFPIDETKLLKLIGSNYILYLDTTYDENMIKLNFVQDVARKFQKMRKLANLQPWDNITLHLQTNNQNVIDILTTPEYVEMMFNSTNRHLKLNDKSIENTLVQVTHVCRLEEEIEVTMALTPIIE